MDMKKFVFLFFLLLLLPMVVLAEPLPAKDRALSFWGYGPVKVGMTLEEAEMALGVSLSKDREIRDQNKCHYAMNDEVLPGLAFMLVNQRIVRIDVYQDGYLTDKGASVGMTEEKLKETYPHHLVSWHPYDYDSAKPDDSGHYIIVNDKEGKYRMIFETSGKVVPTMIRTGEVKFDIVGKVVTMFRTGEYEAVRWIEGCE